jgi:branched-chain amino acid transport system substrate-binding protein
VLGEIDTVTGPQAAAGGKVPEAAAAWVDWTNAHGGINGHPVKLIVMDDGGDPAKALQVAQQLVVQDKIQALVGSNSFVIAGWGSYIAKSGVPAIGGLPSDSPWYTEPNFFPSGTNEPAMIMGQFVELKKQNLNRFGLLYCAESPICAQLGGLAQYAAGLVGGVTVVKQGKVAATQPTYIPSCLSMKEANVNALQVAQVATVGVSVANACATLGYKPLNVNQTPSVSTTWLNVPGLNGTILTAPNANYTDPSLPAVKDFLDALNTYAPGLTSGSQFAYGTIFPWIGGQLFAAAAEAGHLSPSSTPAQVKAAMYLLKNETLGGLTPPLTYTAGKPTAIDCYFTEEISNGKFVSTNNNQPVCPSPSAIAGLNKLISPSAA